MTPRFDPVALNGDRYSRIAPFGVAILSAVTGRPAYLLAPVFRERYQAEVFAEVYPAVFPEAESARGEEIDLADEILEFQARYDDEPDGVQQPYGTKDGQYPSARIMADRFLEARQRTGSDR